MAPRRKAPKIERRERGGPHAALLSDPNVRTWYDERALRSRLSADVYLRQLGGISERLELTPAAIVTEAKEHPDRLRSALVRYAGRLKEEGRLESYIAKTLDGLRSWLTFRDVTFAGYPRLSPVRQQSLSRERVPTPEELGSVLERLSLRGRVIALFMAHTGIRPGVLGSYGGEHGLTLGDLPDLTLRPAPAFEETPFVVRVPATLSKTRREYTTFGGRQLAGVFLAYLGDRAATSERLTARSPVVAAAPTRGASLELRKNRQSSEPFLSTKAIVREIREGLKAAVPDGTTWRPYVLRAYCSTRLLLAQGQALVPRDLAEAILGHDTGISGTYHVGKRWGPELLAEARRAYGKCEPLLSTSIVKAEPDQRELKRALLAYLEFTDDQIAEEEREAGGEVSWQRIIEVTRDLKRAAGGPPLQSQIVVPATELDAWLAKGYSWRANHPVDSARVIMEAPNPRTTH